MKRSEEQRYSGRLLAAVLIAALAVPSAPAAEWYDAKSGVPPIELDRAKALRFFAENVYGVRPEWKSERHAEVVKTEHVDDLSATRKVIRLNTLTPLGEKTFEAVGYFPDGARRAPVFVYISFRSATETQNPRWPIGLILSRGAATVAFCYEDVVKDDAKVLDGVERADNAWGAISAWSLAASRVIDYLVADGDVDPAKIAVVGHSRLGKTAIWTGANDERVAMTVSNDSGCFGARLHSRNICGETINQITARFPHWFAPNARKLYCGMDEKGTLPFDQHWLLAAVSPRLLAVGSAADDWWACPSGEMACWEYARHVWKDQTSTEYHVRPGKHELNSVDWTEYLDFAARKGWFGQAAAARASTAARPGSLEEKIAAAGRKVVGVDLWHGFRRVKFDFDGFVAWVVEPSGSELEGRPWTWTMQWADAFVERTGVVDALKAGYHHATIELFATRMDDAGVETAAAYQRFLVEKLGFAPKANLIGMSWGGFFSVRYAAAHPENVRRIYLDAPLLCLWDIVPNEAPTENARSIGPWAKSVPKSGSWSNDPRMPVNLAAAVAKAKIPVLLLYGVQDQTVDPAKNCLPFVERFRAAGGEITVDRRWAYGHHPHGVELDETGRILGFFR